MYVALVAGGQFPKLLTVCAYFENRPCLVRPAAGKHDPPGVPVQFHMLDDRTARMAEQSAGLGGAAKVRYLGDIVVPSGSGRSLLAFLPPLSAALPGVDRRGRMRVQVAIGLARATDYQDLVDVQKRICQQRLAGQLIQRFLIRFPALDQVAQAFHVFGALVLRTVGLAQILYRPHQRLGRVDGNITVVHRPGRQRRDQNCRKDHANA